MKIEEYIGLQTSNTNMLNYLDWIVKHEETQRRQQLQEAKKSGTDKSSSVAHGRRNTNALSKPGAAGHKTN